MSLSGDFKGASTFAKVAVIIMLLSNFFNWIAFTTTYWVPGTGLWRTCSIAGTTSSCRFNDGNDLEFFQATQAFVSFGFIGINVVFILSVLYIWITRCMRNTDISFWGAILAFITAVSYLIGLIIFGFEIRPTSPDWSYAMGVIAMVLEVLGGVFLLLAGKK